MCELTFVKTGHLEWREREAPVIEASTDVLVRPLIASRCDGDCLPLRWKVSRPMQAAIKLCLIDPVVSCIVGRQPYKVPFGIGHECVAQVTEVGGDVRNLEGGDVVIVPWALSCESCKPVSVAE